MKLWDLYRVIKFYLKFNFTNLNGFITFVDNNCAKLTHLFLTDLHFTQWPFSLCVIKWKVIILQCQSADLRGNCTGSFHIPLQQLTFFFTLYLFKQRSAQFHCLLPNGYFSVVLEWREINDTCQSLKCTFIKQTSTASHEPGEHLVARSGTFIDRTCKSLVK